MCAHAFLPPSPSSYFSPSSYVCLPLGCENVSVTVACEPPQVVAFVGDGSNDAAALKARPLCSRLYSLSAAACLPFQHLHPFPHVV